PAEGGIRCTAAPSWEFSQSCAACGMGPGLRWGGWCWSGVDQRAAALAQRTECLVRRRAGDELVQIPLLLALGRGFYLEQVARVQLASVHADAALAETVVVGRHRFHSLDYRAAVRLGRRNAQVGDRLQVMQRRRVVAGMEHVRPVARCFRTN